MRFEMIFGIQKAEHQQRMVLRTMRVQDLKAADQGDGSHVRHGDGVRKAGEAHGPSTDVVVRPPGVTPRG